MDPIALLYETALPTAISMSFGFAFMTAFELLLPRERHSLAARLNCCSGSCGSR